MYDLYAQFYDGTGQIRFSLLFYQYLQDLLASHPLPPPLSGSRRALDLGCGTGTLALLLADGGWQASGLELSPAMLGQARQKAAALGLEPELVQGDMRDFAGRWQDLDLVTCVYDSLNYLLEPDDLLACFRSVAAVLRPGGVFVADLNSRYVLQEVWVGTEVHEQNGYVQVQQLCFDALNDCSHLRLTGMVGDDEHGYARFDEQHIQRAYDPELVTSLLAVAGMPVEGYYDAFTVQPPGPQAQRLVWVARLPITGDH